MKPLDFFFVALFVAAVAGALLALSGCGGAEFTVADTQIKSAVDAEALSETSVVDTKPDAETPPADVLLDVAPDAAVEDAAILPDVVNTPDAPLVQDAGPEHDAMSCNNCHLNCLNGAVRCCTAQQTCGCQSFGLCVE